jgi:catechol 2,3-dioxygenase-like lactoylglutathione lyase family enzyme
MSLDPPDTRRAADGPAPREAAGPAAPAARAAEFCFVDEPALTHPFAERVVNRGAWERLCCRLEERGWRRVGFRTLARATTFALALAGAHAGALRAQPAGSATQVAVPRASTVRVGPVGMTVSDMPRAIAFYHDVLTFSVVADTEVAGEALERLSGVFGARVRVVRMRLAGEEIELSQYLAPEGRPIPMDARSNDRAFQHIAIIVSDMDSAYARLRRFGVRHASSGPQLLPAWNPNAGGIAAFYFKDPDGHVLEVLHFPPGKGDPRWHAGAPLFLGIDHTAIVVGDTERALAFYRDCLGFRVAGTSENWGTEQEHLNNVFGARLRITSLKRDAGPSIEFLEYLAPRDGRPYPADSRANDLWQWQTTLVAGDFDTFVAGLRAHGAAFISPGAVRFSPPALGMQQGLFFRDPDGHALKVIEP